jgi:hypothetical protein
MCVRFKKITDLLRGRSTGRVRRREDGYLFNPTTTIEFTLPEAGKASLKIYDVLGREVAKLVNGELKAGVTHQARLDASKLSTGIYFSRLEFSASDGSGKQLMKKLLLIK